MQSNWKHADLSEIVLASVNFNINRNCTTKVNVTYTIILLSVGEIYSVADLVIRFFHILFLHP